MKAVAEAGQPLQVPLMGQQVVIALKKVFAHGLLNLGVAAVQFQRGGTVIRLLLERQAVGLALQQIKFFYVIEHEGHLTNIRFNLNLGYQIKSENTRGECRV